MAIQRKNRADLRAYFQTGDRPTQTEFEELIESVVNIENDKATQSDIDAATPSDDKFVTVSSAQKLARKSIKVNNVAPDATTGNILLPVSEAPLTFGAGLTRAGNVITANSVQSNALTGTSLPATVISSSLTSFGNTPTLVTPKIGAATGTSLAVTGAITSSSGAIGYAAGNGGVVTQATSKGTGVTLNKLAGDITTANVALAAATIISFTLTNSAILATDIIHLQHQSGGTFGAYTLNGRTAAGSAIISIRNNTAAALTEAIVIRFIVIRSVIS